MAAPFEVNETVLCYHGPLMYQAKILDITTDADGSPLYLVHYMGWNNKWDDWVVDNRLMKINAENNARAEAIKNEVTQAKQGTKRKRTHEDRYEDYTSQAMVNIAIPKLLRLQLVEEWELVTRNQQLVPLPRSPTVREFCNEYLESKGPTEGPRLHEFVEGLIVYFDRALPTILLYAFERPQYNGLRQRQQLADAAPCEVYGVEHFLRLFVKLPILIAHTAMEAEAVTELSARVADVMAYLAKRKTLFLKEYTPADSDYVNSAK